MTQEEFNAVLSRRIELTKKVLEGKAGEYATDADRLHNFKKGGEVANCSPQEACAGYMLKHFVSVLDLANSGKVPSREVADEKIGDAVNYLILLEAIWEEERKQTVTHSPEQVQTIKLDFQYFYALADKKKTCTIRHLHRPYKLGTTVLLCGNDDDSLHRYVVVTRIDHTYLQDVALYDLQDIGCKDHAEALVTLRQFYPDIQMDSPVTVVRWVY